MKKIFLTILISTMAFLNGYTQNITLTAGTVNGVTGQVATVPVTISGIDGDNGGTPIIGFQIYLTYQTSVVSYLQLSDLNATLTSVGTWENGTANSGTVSSVWYENGFVGTSLVDGSVLFNINYIANNGGTSPLNFFNIEFTDNTGNPIFASGLNNGSITFAAPPATSTWNGTGIWYTPSNWSNGVPGQATQAIIASGVVTVDASTGYTGNLTVNPGAGITINSAKTLSVNGNLVLESNATPTATGSILNSGNLVVTGTTTVKRWLSGATQHFISIPVSAASIAGLINPSNTGYFFRFLESTSAWDNPWDPSFQLTLANGYSVNYDNAQMLSLNGALNNDNSYAPIITRLGGGWNLVGNAYPCPIDWTLASGWTKTNLDNAIYVWNNNAYASYVNGVGTNGGSKYIPQFQGFFVHSSTGTPALTMRKAARNQGGNDTLFMKDAITNVFKMSITNGNLSDETAVYFTEGATESFDTEYDAYKLFGFNMEAPHIYTRSSETDFAINGQPNVESVTLSLVVKTSQEGAYTFTAKGFETFDPLYFFILEDQLTGIQYDLKQNSTLSLDLGQGETEGRFSLRIFKSSMGIGDDFLSSTRIYAEGQNIRIENCPESVVTIYSLAGKTLATEQMPEASLNSIFTTLPAGIYLVKLNAAEGTLSSKIFIK